MQGLLGKKDGYMSKRGLVFMLLSWLIHKGYLRNAQDPAALKETPEKKAVDFPPSTPRLVIGNQIEPTTDYIKCNF